MPLTPPVTCVETHSAFVVFVGDRAYKVKKPVDLGFLDFSTREQREVACHREVELNRRLAADVYLGVADVVGPDGTPCDHMVVMRRMPEDRRLSRLLGSDPAAHGCLRAVARQVAVLHASAATSRDRPEIASVATRDAVASNWQDNLDTLQPFVGDVVDGDEYARVRWSSRRYLAGRAPLFDRRIRDGDVRDGHGDLLAEDVFCLPDGPRILDCLDFADRYRFGDVLLDVAFLAMDLERLGHADQAVEFLRWYREFSGAPQPTSLAHHYIAYRAHVRAKVACVRRAQGVAGLADEARRLHAMTLEHLRAGRVVMVLVGGLPGTGKSTIASGLADARGWALLRSDEIRKDLAGLGRDQSATGAVDAGLYRPDHVTETYHELLARGRALLELGESVVLDATWTSAAARRQAEEVARSTHADVVGLSCQAAPDLARARLASRPPGGDVSDATPTVYDAMAARADPWPDAAVVPTGHAVDQALATALRAVAARLDELEAAGAS